MIKDRILTPPQYDSLLDVFEQPADKWSQILMQPPEQWEQMVEKLVVEAQAKQKRVAELKKEDKLFTQLTPAGFSVDMSDPQD